MSLKTRERLRDNWKKENVDFIRIQLICEKEPRVMNEFSWNRLRDKHFKVYTIKISRKKKAKLENKNEEY